MENEILKCKNESCPSSNKCHRFLFVSNVFSKVSVEIKLSEDERCIYFIDNEKIQEAQDTRR